MSKARRFTASLEVPSRGSPPTTISAPILITSPGPLMKNPAGYAGINIDSSKKRARSPSDGAIPAPAIVMASSAAASMSLPMVSVSGELSDQQQPQQGPTPAEKQTPSSPDLLELKAEVARLQDREAALSHMLSLEKEQRVKAEQLVEVERMACLELKHRLHLETKEKDDGHQNASEEVDGADVDFAKLSDDVSDMLQVSLSTGKHLCRFSNHTF